MNLIQLIREIEQGVEPSSSQLNPIYIRDIETLGVEPSRVSLIQLIRNREMLGVELSLFQFRYRDTIEESLCQL